MTQPAPDHPDETDVEDITNVLLSEEDEAGSITLINRVEKSLARMPLARLTTVAPRTARWAIEAALTEAGRIPGAPQIRMTAALAAQVAMDEAVVALMQGPNRTPRRADYKRVSAELREAEALFDDRGWLDDPRSYHRDPEPLVDVSFSSGWALGQRYRRMSWDSGYHARPEEPGAQRWDAFERNHTASAWLLEHDDGPRPWVVCVHGFGTGAPFSDMITFRAQHLHHDLGWNVAAIVLPVHGSRSPSRMGGEHFLSFDMINSVHALAQSAWDVRRLLSWVRTQEPTSLVLHGVSLGGYVTALTTCLDGDFDAVIAGIPICDFPALFAHQSPRHVRERAAEHQVLEGHAEVIHRVVSPLAMPSLVPVERRFIFAGLGDRMAIPAQTQALWQHWDHPTISWFPGNHVGYLWSKKVAGFVDGILGDLAPAPVE
ncbi:MAG: alpha/beta hydrolase [Candidatus Microthrix sp.]|nr:alpha/beta hydrolase [Candidatus Microthrix sp.]